MIVRYLNTSKLINDYFDKKKFAYILITYGLIIIESFSSHYAIAKSMPFVTKHLLTIFYCLYFCFPHPVTSCQENHFLCADGEKCIPIARRCDQRPDCRDKSDETPDCSEFFVLFSCTLFYLHLIKIQLFLFINSFMYSYVDEDVYRAIT